MRELDEVRLLHDFSKYKRHIDSSMKVITNVAAEGNDRLNLRKSRVEQNAAKRSNQGIEREEKTEKEEEAELMATQLEKKVEDLTTLAEKALRDLIDYRDELAMHDTIMREVSESVAADPAAHLSGRGQNDRADEGEDDSAASNPSILSAVELLKKSKEDYAATYASKSMLDRYDHYASCLLKN